jgi:hypothetical protein
MVSLVEVFEVFLIALAASFRLIQSLRSVGNSIRLVVIVLLGLLLGIEIFDRHFFEGVYGLIGGEHHVVDAPILGNLLHFALKASFEIHVGGFPNSI